MHFFIVRRNASTQISIMHKLVAFIPIALLVFAAGCATTPPPRMAAEEVAKFDYGTFPDNYQQLIKDYFAKTLQDPASAQYRFGTPYTGYLQQGRLLGGKLQEAGYFTEVWLKAKTPTGYTPEKRLVVLIKNREVLMELRDEDIDRIKR
jgi:hypothetical protein